MSIISIGTDIVSVLRIQNAMSKHEGFLERILTEEEIGSIEKQPEHFAGIWAAKEAAAKALKTGIGQISWREITVFHESNGAPCLKFSGRAEIIAQKLGVQKTFLSISHEREYALAIVVLEG